ncbi:hypothetical protein C7120_09285 [Prevotella sp. oral taxon 376]|uniref:hypothetical protein n=1 Tax=Prevotella sp. oral taxon 376 TaxID=712466 RepID=UPI000D1E37AA|nr:hypothetical protein [Prevotella sp. oral taxon 376]PTL34558.1 hypothetical protein C7120_08630 [Prevotella sp. oral taxon 376]PTL34681.1 hypothetical protein C7120_09285 [Prevotella sp. oral taxon 376]
MENRIVQLSEYEYNELQEKAELNDGKIRDLAKKYYQEHGVFRIDIRVGFQDKYNGDTVFYTNVFSHENGLYKNDEFGPIITEKGRRKIERILSDACTETFERKFGDAIEFKNRYADALRRFTITRCIAYTIAFSGWGVAAVLLINSIFK